MDRFERKMGGSRLPNLMQILVGCYAAGFILEYVWPYFSTYVAFMPEMILQGQVWRLLTFVMIPSSSNIFSALLTCFVYFSISKALEQIIGRFRLNIFLIMGILMLDLVGFAYYFLFSSNEVLAVYAIYTMAISPNYLYSMLFVLFAMIYPNAQFLFMFIIPIRGKFMVFITLAMCGLDVIQAFANNAPAYGWILVAMIFAAILTLVLFVLLCGYKIGGNVPQNVVRMRKTRRATAFENATKVPFRHKCAICGRTDVTNPELTFRYCSKCEGDYEYCNEHLYTHVHKMSGTGNSTGNTNL